MCPASASGKGQVSRHCQLEEYDELEEEIESTQNGGRIVISEVAYPGVKMTIANVSSFIHNETKHSAFVRDGAEIRVRAI